MTFWKQEMYETLETSLLVKDLEVGGRDDSTGGAHGSFREAKLHSMIQKRWVHVIIHLPKPIRCTTPGMNPTINYGA